jgi:phage N-6-adenine-methyltransferase
MHQIAVPKASSRLKLYKPKQGLIRIAAFETAQRHFARAKNLDGLTKAIEEKLKAQREFALWWDAFGEKRGSGPSQRCPRSATSLPVAGRNGLPDRRLIHRWRALENPQKFAQTLAAAKEKARALCEGDNQGYSAINTGEIEWYTPPEWIVPVRAVLGDIDLDPASSRFAQKTVQARQYFTKTDEALNREWHGSVFLNAPYSRDALPRFLRKLTDEFRAGHVNQAIALTNAFTDTGWFHELASVAGAICFTRGRIHFMNIRRDQSTPVHGQAFFYLGPDVAKFVLEFVKFGLVVMPLQNARRL